MPPRAFRKGKRRFNIVFYLSISLSLSTKARESVVISLSPAWKFFVCNVYGGNGGPAGRDVFPIFSGSHSSLDIYCIGSEFSASGRMFPSSPGSPSVHLSFVPPLPFPVLSYKRCGWHVCRGGAIEACTLHPYVRIYIHEWDTLPAVCGNRRPGNSLYRTTYLDSYI